MRTTATQTDVNKNNGAAAAAAAAKANLIQQLQANRVSKQIFAMQSRIQ